MAFEYWGYTFEGACPYPNNLESRAGVYVIWCKSGETWTLLDVGESHDVKNRVLSHDRRDCWKKNCTGTIFYAATYTPNLEQAGRTQVEQRIRSLRKPTCGNQ